MNIIRKDATITSTGADDDFPGTFEVVLSSPAKDRDGDELAAEDWKQPLPEHITFDSDHGMSVATTVGSGTPRIDGDGNMIVSGTFSSLDRAQEVRTLVKEKHIRTTSVAFMSSRSTKDGKTRVTRELLNGAFVAIPSNRDAVVLSSKSVEEKAGARHSKSDAERIQAIHDHALALGAKPADDTGAEDGATGGKSFDEFPAQIVVNGKTYAVQYGEVPAATTGDETQVKSAAADDPAAVEAAGDSAAADETSDLDVRLQGLLAQATAYAPE